MRRTLLPPLLLACLLASAPVSANNPGRGVYVNGEIHRIYKNSSSGKIRHVAGRPTSSTDWTFLANADQQESPWSMCVNVLSASGLAVFDDKIFFAYTSSDCGNLTPMWAYVATFDLPTKSWTTRKQLGTVHTDLASNGHGAGAAITVFDGKLIVFTDAGTYTSADGVGWSTYGPLVSNGKYQPLDAVTYFPPGADPRVLVVYGYIDGKNNYYSNLSYATWNGQLGSASDFPSSPILDWNLWVYGQVSLQPGTRAAMMGYPAGTATNAIQVFAETPTSDGSATLIRNAEFLYTASGISGTQSHTFNDGQASDLWTYTWYTDLCSTTTTPIRQARQQVVVAHYSRSGNHAYAGNSDVLVPVNGQSQATQCGVWGGTVTDTGSTADPTAVETYRKYWTLYGVVLGSPPFFHNWVPDYDVGGLSNVEYGKDQSTSIQHSQEWENTTMFSAGLEVHAGLHKGPLEAGLSLQADIGYTHGLQKENETSSGLTTGYNFTLGTEASAHDELEELGKVGWGIVGVPKLLVQDFNVYAYDYDLAKGTGTSLNQNVHVVEVSPGAVSVTGYAFDLEDPATASNGLFAGMNAYPTSTDLEGWSAQSWALTGTQPWEMVCGDAGECGFNELTFGDGIQTESTVLSKQETVASAGETKEAEVSGGASIEAGLKLFGFKTDLKAGYTATYKTKVTTTTGFETSLSASLKMMNCSKVLVPKGKEGTCVERLEVQPYLLSAKEGAPWIPTGFSGQLPWALTWRVANVERADGSASGLSAPPGSGSGLVVGGQGGSATSGESTWSSYVFRGAMLGWKSPGRKARPLPMTAAEFKPAKGITLEVNGFKWSSLGASGTWTRLGKVWLYESRRSVQRNKVFVTLDFGKGTWDLELSRVDLSGHLAANTGNVHVTLVLNGKLALQSDLRNHADTTWRWVGLAKKPKTMELTSYEGRHDSASRAGRAALEGTLPEKLATFGDMSFELNGRVVHVPLLDNEELRRARENAGRFVHDKDGVHVLLDFGKAKWLVRFENQAFHPQMAPVRGKTRVKVRVGGEPWGTSDLVVEDFTARLKLYS